MTKIGIGEFSGIHFVVSRYNEYLEWLPKLLIKFPGSICTVYNKGDDIIGHELYNVVPLKNVGRETDTYLHHVIFNYDNLDDVTVFLQGSPFDHCLFKNINIAWNNCKNGSGFENIIGTPSFYPSNGVETYERLRLCVRPPKFKFSHGSVFSVRKDMITTRTKKFYELAISMV